MRRQVNLRFVALILASLATLGIGTHLIHGYQVRRNAGALLRRAEDARAEKDFNKALGYYGRYLQFRPDDTAALASYALLLEQESRTPAAQLRAYLILEETLRRLPERDDVRRCVVRLAMQPALSRFAETRDDLTVLLKSSPDDAELEELFGRCEEGCGHFTRAADWYDKAIGHDEHRVDAYVRLADLYRGRLDPPRNADADGVMERLVKANPESVQARLARGAYLRRLGLLTEAGREIGYARERLAPDRADVLLSSADLALANGNRDEARRHLEEGLRRHGDDVRFHLGLATLALRGGDRDGAVARLREAVKVLPERSDLIWTTADLFLDAGEPKEAEQLLKRLNQAATHPAAVDYLRARLAYGDGRFAEARTLLEKQRPDLAKWPDLARQADVLLGQCYQRLDDPEEQLAAYRRAATSPSATLPARLGLGAALLANDQLDEAIAEYRKLTPALPELRLTVVRLLILRNLRLAPARRDWSEPERLLREAPEQVRKTVDYTIRNAELLVARGEVKQAAAALEAACKQAPQEVRYWTARAAVADRTAPAEKQGRFADSFRVLDEAEKALGDRVELRLERAGRLAASSAASAREALRKLEGSPAKATPAERTALRIGLAAAYERLGDTDSARRLLRQSAEESPGDLHSRERLFDLALAAGDDADAQRQRDGIRAIEGDGGPLGRCAEAMRLVARARKGDRAGLAEARRLLAEVAKARPNWSRRELVAAEISDLQGDVEPAIEGYRRAIDLGERSPATVHRAVRLLIARRRTDEARQVLARLQERAATVPDLGRDAAELSLLNQEPKERTRELARAVVRDSKDYRDLLFLGQVLWSLDGGEDRQKAEDAFRQAVKLGPKAPEAWFALVAFLAGTDRKKQAEEETRRAKEALPAKEAAPALAACYEAVGRRDQAEEYYLAALKSSPNDAGVLRGAAAFYLRGGDVKKAEPHLRRLINGTDEAARRWARRTLALSLAGSGDYSQSRDGLALLDENLRERAGDPNDQRARALVLALRPGGRRESIRSLEASFAHLRPAPAEQFLLARLYEADRNWPRAKELLLGLLGAAGGDNPAFLAYYATASLRHDGVKEAEKWLPRLEKAPDSAPVVEARARLIAARGQGDEAARLLTQFAHKEQTATKDPAILRAAAGVLEELGQLDGAEKLCREYAAAVGAKRPENALVLALFLAKRNRLPEALDLCERAWTQCPPEVVARVSAGALRLGQPRPEDFRRVEHWLDVQIRQKPESAGLLLARADLRDAEGRTEEAEAAYRDLLTRDPRNPMAMNNLAWLLAMSEGKYNEALELVNRAVEVAGPVASRLDTRGMVRLLMGQTNQAVADLEDSAAEHPTDAVYFHLVRAYLQGRNRPAAERAWDKAKELHLSEKSLHRLEWPEYQRLAADMERK